MREGGYSDIADYVRALIETDVVPGDRWEVTPEIAALLEEADRSGYVPYDFDEIIAEAQSEFDAQ